MNNTEFTRLGGQAVVTLAQLLDLQSPANQHGDARTGGSGIGKHAGMKALIDMGANTTVLGGDALSFHMYKEVMALGPKSSDPWVDVSLATTLLVPVNIVDPDQTTTTWTVDNNATYVNGLITGADAEAVRQVTQDVVLKAGTYKIIGTQNRANALRATKLTVTGATDGVVLAKRNDSAIVSADNSQADAFDDTWTFTLLAASQTVTFGIKFQTISNDAAAAGIGRFRFILESA